MYPLEGFSADGRMPVVASGSNGSPQRLAEKYGDKAEIPVTFGTIRDLVPVFAARVTGYGSIPATLAVMPGQTARVHVTWLTESQLEIMHGTESVGVGYAYARLTGFALDLGAHGQPNEAFAYLSLSGAFCPMGRPMQLAAVSQRQIQTHAMLCADEYGTLEAFVARHIHDLDFRDRINRVLARFGQRIEHPGIERLI